MNKQYRELFQLVARNGALNAETAIKTISEDREQDHSKEIASLTSTRDMFNILEDRLLAGEEIAFQDYVLLYAGAVVTRNLVQKNINTWTAVVKEYDENLIPKLTEVAHESDEIKRKTLIEDFFGE